MLQIKNLSLTHRKDLHTLAENFSLTLNPKDKAVLIGEEGNGKSTILRWIYDPALIESYMEAKGERILARERLSYLPQELSPEDAQKTVYEYFSEEPQFFEKNPRELAELSARLQMTADFFYSEQLMGTLSGGERVRTELLRALLSDPTTLLLDEPSNDIDIRTLEFLEKLINDFPGIVLYISHDETLIENTANMVIHLEQLRHKTLSRWTVSRLAYRDYVSQRESKMEHQEEMARSDRREKKIRDEKFRRIQEKVEANLLDPSHGMHDALGRLAKKKMHAVKSMGRRFEREDENMTEFPETEEAIFFKLGTEKSVMPAGKTVLEYRLPALYAEDDGGTRFSDSRPDLRCNPETGTHRLLSRGIFLRIRGPERVCIIGDNGCGKTTLLRKIVETLRERTDLRCEYMPQNYEELLDFSETPVDYLDKTGDKEERTRIRTYLGAMKFTGSEMDHPIRELSGGQKAKVFLLRMSLSDANLLILDEPTRNFSPLSGPVIRSLLSSFPGAILSVSHDRKFISEVCTRVLELTPEGLSEKTD